MTFNKSGCILYFKENRKMIKWVILLLLPLFLLVVIVSIGNKVFTTRTKYVFQKFKQFMIYFIEMYVIIFIGISAITYFETDSFIFWRSNESFFDYFQRGLAFFSTYQLFVFATLKLSVSADKDSYLAYKKALNYTLHYIDNNKVLIQVKKFLEENYESPMYSNEIKDSLNELIRQIEIHSNSYENKDFKKKLIITLKSNLIDVEHTLETYNLAWMNSFLLYILK